MGRNAANDTCFSRSDTDEIMRTTGAMGSVMSEIARIRKDMAADAPAQHR